MTRPFFLTLLFLLIIGKSFSQGFTRQDSLRGSITPERAWWDLKHYTLDVTVNPNTKTISGKNTMRYTVLNSQNILQIDLQPPMKLEKVVQNGKALKKRTDGNAHFISLEQNQTAGKDYEITFYFSGMPHIAIRPPWDGGFTWSKDSKGNDFIATSNQGIGASIWWPNKDHPYDEPDNGIDLLITAPKYLKAVGNGRLVEVRQHASSTKTWHWRVVNPINNYGVNINIGNYVRFGETFEGMDGTLDLDYWVLEENLEKAKKQFDQVPMLMQAFEYWFGPYPFYEDSFKLVEVPYLGMEHQSSVTYGNGYRNGFVGKDVSGTGWGLKFDYIIIHEAAHEWFANNITNSDVADMWIHEGFTTYAENLYLDYHYGTRAAREYVIGSRRDIKNVAPIIGAYNVHQEGSGDMYTKGAAILHTLRQLLEDDEKWRSILQGLNTEFRHKTVSSAQVEEFISKKSGIDLTEFWQQYVRTTQIPILEYRVIGKELRFRYTNIIENFDMPVIMLVNGKEDWIFPKASWKTKSYDKSIESVTLKPDFLVGIKKH